MVADRAGLAAEKAYVRRIERKFLSLREGGLVISPRDFGLLLDWYQRGIPAEIVTAAIEEVFRKTEERTQGRSIRSIAYCRHAVEEAWKERRAAMTGSAPASSATGSPALTDREVVAHLVRVTAALREAASRAGAGSGGLAGARRLDAIAVRLEEIREEVARKAPASYEATEDEMVRLEAESVAAAEEILPAAEREDLARSAEERIDPFVSRMSEKGRKATRRRAVEAALRERLGLPRLSLFTIAR